MDMIKDFLPFLAIALSIVNLFMTRRKTGAEVENIRVSTDDKKFDTLNKEVKALKEIVDDRGERIDEMESRYEKETTRLIAEADKERRDCAEQMTDMHTMWTMRFNAQEKRIQELEQQLKK